jgi:hypothetical protein
MKSFKLCVYYHWRMSYPCLYDPLFGQLRSLAKTNLPGWALWCQITTFSRELELQKAFKIESLWRKSHLRHKYGTGLSSQCNLLSVYTRQLKLGLQAVPPFHSFSFPSVRGERRDCWQHIKKQNTPTFRSCQVDFA